MSALLPRPLFSDLLRPFLRDRLLHVLLILMLLLWLPQPAAVSQFSRWIDWPTIATLAGLLLLTKGVESSGYLSHLGRLIINRLPNERALALFLVSMSALLSTVLTNDVALFIVVPLTVSLRGMAGLPIGRLVIFEALAVNAGSLLTPIGNPQNILLWQLSGQSFTAFTWQMAPLALGSMALLLLATALAFPKQPVHTELHDTAAGYQPRLLAVCALLYVGFVLALESGHPGWGLVAVVTGVALLRPALLLTVDWSLIAVFMLMFVDIRLLTGLPALRHATDALAGLGQTGLYLTALLGSQLISNVPATILLVKYSSAYKVLAYSVNAGGFGCVLGSLANLIALRMAGERGIWLQFHLYSLPALLLVGVLGYCLL
jgi:Na+/H+ antiporter NhaD/arsenite permease-like protein